MIFAKQIRYGLEQQVYAMQEALEAKLSWNGTINIYGLLFKNAINDNYILEAWTGADRLGREYTQVFNQDKTTAQIGFIEVSRNPALKNAIVDIICTIDLEKAYNNNIRDNERAYLEFNHIISNINKVTGFERGINNVFSGFRIDNIKYLDIQPYDAFRYRVEMVYNNSICK